MKYKYKSMTVDFSNCGIGPELYELAQNDGRFLSIALETMLCTKFKNFVKLNGNETADIIDDEGNMIEVRTLAKKSHVFFESASNVGGGGRQNNNNLKTIDKLNKIDYWLFCQTANFPLVDVVCIDRKNAKALCSTKQGNKQFPQRVLEAFK